MSRKKQWAATLCICSLFLACGMFSAPAIKDGKVCEVIDFGGGAKFEVCAGTASQLALIKQDAAERRVRLAK